MKQETITSPDEKLNFKKILPIFVIVLVDLLGLTIIIPLLPLYAASFGADPFTIGILSTAYPLMQLIGGPVLGGVSDRFGRKPVLLISQIGTLIGFLILGFASSLPLLLLSRIIDGLSGGNIVAAQAAITDSTTEKTRAQGLGLIGAAFGLGFTLGPAIAGVALVLSSNNYHIPAFLAAGFSLISVVLTFFWFHETLPEEKRGRRKEHSGNFIIIITRTVGQPLIGSLMILMFLQQLVFGGFEALLALFNLSRLGMDAAGNALVFVFVGIILVLVQGKYIGPWSRRYGERKLIYAGLALLSVGLILTAVTPQIPVPWYSRTAITQELSTTGTTGSEAGISHDIAVPLPQDSSNGWVGLIWLLAAMIPATIGGGILSPSINSLITKRTAPTAIGGTLGVSSSLVSVANTITPLIGGALFQILGTTAPFLVGGVVMGMLVFMAIRYVQPGPEEQVQVAAV